MVSGRKGYNDSGILILLFFGLLTRFSNTHFQGGLETFLLMEIVNRKI